VFTAAQALRHPKVNAIYSERIKARLADVSHAEQVQKFTLLGQGFTIDSGELTPTLKIRRNVVAQNYAREIEAMYANSGTESDT
jgi:long-chain acyl-CoA synthetase